MRMEISNMDNKKPHCPVCGAACPECRTNVDDYTLMALKEPARIVVKDILKTIGYSSQVVQDKLVRGLLPYSNKHIVQAHRIWRNMDTKGKSAAYFIAIVRGCSVKKETLDAMPPRLERIADE